MNRILVVGHRGMLGTDLMELLAAAGGKGDCPLEAVRGTIPFSARGVDLPDVDITDRSSIDRSLDDFRPDTIINCAAYTRVDDAEGHPDEARRINAGGAGLLAASAASRGARIIHISTDFVFDGRKPAPYVETDVPAPVSVYGATKLEGERLVAAEAPDHLIVRTSWLYGRHGKNFVTTIRELAAKRDELTVVDDQRGCPTWTRDLSRAIWELSQTDARGIVHAVGRGVCTWFEFASEVVRQSGLRTRVRAISSAELCRPATRPANSALDTSLLRRLTGFEFPRWQDSLAGFLDELRRTP